MSNTTVNVPRFSLGRLVATPGALATLNEAGQSPTEFLQRHARLERGELCAADHRENLYSVDKPLRMFSAYKTALGLKLWVITEADRSATTILLPEDELVSECARLAGSPAPTLPAPAPRKGRPGKPRREQHERRRLRHGRRRRPECYRADGEV
jgi:hypothetical protein